MMNKDILNNIQAKLSEMEKARDCRILFAVESGSRAWGYASETSDYDVRCVYFHPAARYLSILPLRDTTEWELNDVYDINGWDLRKALQLALRSNISVFEWADSPIVYRTSPWHEEFRAVTRSVMQPGYLASRYVGMAVSTYKRYLTLPNPPFKQYFYALRPLLAARWVLQEQAPAPLLFSTLCEALLPAEMRDEVDELLLLRSSGTEKATGPLRPRAQEFICREIAALQAVLADFTCAPSLSTAALDAFFRRVVADGAHFAADI